MVDSLNGFPKPRPRLRPALKTLGRDRRGVIIVMFALMLPILLGFIGLGVEVAYWFQNHRTLQAAADAAAIAGSYEVNEGRPTATQTIATREATSNGWTNTGANTITVNNFQSNNTYPTGTYSNDYSTDTAAVEVIITLDVVRMFSGWFMSDDVTLNAVAVSTTTSSGDACIMALNPSADSALKISGNITMTMDCGLAVSSSSSKGLDISGNSDFDVNEICVTGGTSNSGNNTFADATPTDSCNTPSDPLSGLAEPSNADDACDQTDYDIGADPTTLNPGVYCNGIKISGSGQTITFNAGTYILAGGNGLQTSGSNNTINADGVTFYITDNHGDGNYPDVNLSGGNTFDISAPTSGDYAGVLFFNDSSAASASSGAKFNVSGNNTFDNFDGVVYYPNHEISLSGNSTSSSSCGPKFLSDTVTISGNIDVYGGGSGCASDNVTIGNSLTIGLVE